jgi:hypothetical protein
VLLSFAIGCGLLLTTVGVLAWPKIKLPKCCTLPKPTVVVIVEQAAKGRVDPVAVASGGLAGSGGISLSKASEAVSSAVSAATPSQIKDAIRGGQKITDTSIEAIKSAGNATVRQVVRQAEFVTGSAQATVTCLTEKDKCGRALNEVGESVDKLAAGEIQWVGERMVSIGKLHNALQEEMGLLNGEALDAMSRIQEAAGPGSLFDPTARSVEAYEQVTGDSSLKEAYDKYFVKTAEDIRRVEKESFKFASGQSLALGNFAIGAGTAIERLGFYLGLSSAGFPRAESGAPPQLRTDEKAAFAASVSVPGLNAILDGLQGEQFAIGKSAKKLGDEKEYLSIDDFEARLDTASRTIMVVAKDGRIRTRVGNSLQGVKLGAVRLQLIPSMVTSKDEHGVSSIRLILRPKVLHLDVREFPTRLDQAAAYALNDTALKDPLDVDLSVLTPVLATESTTVTAEAQRETWTRRVAFTPQKYDFLMTSDTLFFRTAGAFERIKDVKK